MKATTEVKRPALRYYGGKWKLAPWIISHFPEHKNYVEPCGGAASVLLQKPRSPLETYNDLDGNVVNFFRVLRDRSEEVIEKIRLTPFAREELNHAKKEIAGDDIERARVFFVRCNFSLAARSIGKGIDWGPQRFSDQGFTRRVFDIDNIKIGLNDITERFKFVQIENKPFSQIIINYDHSESLIYFDPPYVHTERSSTNVYAFEWTDTDHIEAAELLHKVSGYVVVSGYSCSLYTELYEAYGWQRVDKEAQTNSGGKRIESLWLSPRTWDALKIPIQGSLF